MTPFSRPRRQRELTRRKKRNAVFSVEVSGGGGGGGGGGGEGGGMPLCTCWNQNPSKCTNYFQVFLEKNWLYRVHIFSLNMYHGLSLLNNAAILKFSGRVTVSL